MRSFLERVGLDVVHGIVVHEALQSVNLVHEGFPGGGNRTFFGMFVDAQGHSLELLREQPLVPGALGDPGADGHSGQVLDVTAAVVQG